MKMKSAAPRIWVGWLACLLGSFALYYLTASRGAQWQDGGYFVLRAVTGELMNDYGLALTHPLHYYLSRAALAVLPIEPAFAVTLVSSLAAAITIANLFGAVATLTRSQTAALLAAASLALANTFWQMATMAEVYGLTSALLTAECWCLIFYLRPGSEFAPDSTATDDTRDDPFGTEQRARPLALAAMFFFNGLSLSNHNFALLTLPVLVIAAVWGFRAGLIHAGHVLASVGAWIVGSLLFTGLFLRELVSAGDFGAAVQSALFGRIFGDEVFSTDLSAGRMAISMAFVLLNFPNLLIPAAMIGMRDAWRIRRGPMLHKLLFLGFVLHALFAFRYPVADQYRFFLPTYVYLALFAGIGFAALMPSLASPDASRFPRFIMLASILILLTPVTYTFVPGLARRFDVLGYVQRNKPYRDDYRYLFLPWSRYEQSADILGRHAVELSGENGVIVVEDNMAWFAVRYHVLRATRPGVEVVRELDPAKLQEFARAGRPVVLVPRDADTPITHPLTGSWRRTGDLYLWQLEASDEASSPG